MALFTIATLGLVQLLAATPQHVDTMSRAADSAHVLAHARKQQATFELKRVARLPVVDHGGGRCDERIGRLCYFYEGKSAPPPPTEPGVIAEARGELIADLRRAQLNIPSDEWVVGQLVRYLVEKGSADSAAVVARSQCTSARWWCDALTGLAEHAGGRFASAESAYTRALADMPEQERCAWEDISKLLDGDAAVRYVHMSCADKRAQSERMWWLARPSFLQPANDLRTEHLARLTMDRTMRGARNPHGLAWGNDLKELLVRYGWDRGWTRTRTVGADPFATNVSGYEARPSYGFFPSADALIDPSRLSSSSWHLEDPRARARYAPSHARDIAAMPAQLARFPHGDSVTVIAAFDQRADTAFGDAALAGLIIAPGTPGPVRTKLERGLRTGVLIVTAPASASDFVSLEIADSSHRSLRRIREALIPGHPDAISTPLFISADSVDANAVTSLERAASAALPSTVVRAGGRVGIYWEVDLASADTVGEVAVTLTPGKSSAFRKAAELLRLTQRRIPVTVAWQEPPRPGARALGRAIVLDLTGIPSGRYTIGLEVTAGKRILRSSRSMDVLDP